MRAGLWCVKCPYACTPLRPELLMKQFLIDLSSGEKYRKLRLGSAFLLYFLILVLGSIPGARQDVGKIASGLILHASAYSIITFLLFTGYVGRRSHKAIQAFMTVAAMGALDEYVQSFFPYRTAAVSDWMVDVTAAFLTVLLLVTLTKRRL